MTNDGNHATQLWVHALRTQATAADVGGRGQQGARHTLAQRECRYVVGQEVCVCAFLGRQKQCSNSSVKGHTGGVEKECEPVCCGAAAGWEPRPPASGGAAGTRSRHSTARQHVTARNNEEKWEVDQ